MSPSLIRCPSILLLLDLGITFSFGYRKNGQNSSSTAQSLRVVIPPRQEGAGLIALIYLPALEEVTRPWTLWAILTFKCPVCIWARSHI